MSQERYQTWLSAVLVPLLQEIPKERIAYTAYQVSDETIAAFTKEGVGIRSTSRLLKISQGTVTRQIKKIAASTEKSTIPHSTIQKSLRSR